MANGVSTLKSIAQARAKFAWECAYGKDKEYGSLVNKIPTYIKTNGLLNTLAFLYSKSKNDNREEKLLKQICNWLTGQNLPSCVSAFPLIEINKLTTGSNDQEKVLIYLMTCQAKELIQCTTEVLALLNWLRRFAKSE
ncbi:MAG: type III-B CRISPR module-associated protein Cmr5 [Thermaurantimonas sp.]|uniref:type III-B CRISPR module-associated protein Cmr5 n=1 Tax=Thermaurantimonas sp. TaxID=2681568 RepID=UPI00391D7EFE